MGRLRVLGIAVVLLLTFSCGKHHKLLKSTDVDLLYEEGMAYYDEGSYRKSSELLEMILPLVRATSKEEIVRYLYADCFLKMKDYTSASRYFSDFARKFPTSERIEDALFNTAYCYYLEAPNVRLDQTLTNMAISEFEVFVQMYPTSSRKAEAEAYIAELKDRLVEKSYINAKMYYDLGDYRGNNYAAAVIAAQNSMSEYPETKYREELSLLIMRSKYAQAVNSIEAKKLKRYIATVDEYHSFVHEFPDTQYRNEVERMYKQAKAYVDRHTRVD